MNQYVNRLSTARRADLHGRQSYSFMRWGGAILSCALRDSVSDRIQMVNALPEPVAQACSCIGSSVIAAFRNCPEVRTEIIFKAIAYPVIEARIMMRIL